MRALCAAFQSAPHFSSEANLEEMRAYVLAEGVSIRASLQQRGERITNSAARRGLTFQSAPPFRSEANSLPVLAQAGAPEFQSAPHFSSEANTSGLDW